MFARIVAAILLVAASAAALASDEIEPGKPAKIKDGNGILAIDLGASGFVTSVHLERIGSMFGGTTVNASKSTLHLLELAPGEYRLNRINLFGTSYLRVPDQPRYHFKVEAGVVNYPGDIEVAVTARGLFRFHSINRSARLMVDVDHAFPGISASYPLHYQGAFPDTFPEFARRELGSQSADTVLDSATKARIEKVDKDVDAALKPLVDELFARPQMEQGRMNLAGDLVATIEYRDGKHRVSLIDMRNDISVDIYRGASPVDQIHWANDRTLLVTLDVSTGDNNYVARITAPGTAAPTFTTMQIPGHGYFLDVFPHDESHALFVHVESGGAFHFYRIDLTARKFDALQFRGELRLDRGLKQPFYGFLDGAGVLRVAFVLAEGDYALMYRVDADAPWTEVRRFTADTTFDPLALSLDGKQLIARTDEGREQIDIVRVNLPGGDVAETIFSAPGIDTEGVFISRDDRRVLAALLYREGQLETEYVDKPNGALSEMLQHALPGRDITVLDTSADRHAALILASSETQPGTYYYLDVNAKHAKELLSQYPPMPHAHLVPSKRIVTKATDGIEIESYLTLPYQTKPPYPLVVMPHGGPIGIRDALRFDPEVELLADRGYAVLRVNYRGSGGMGKSFEHAGFGAWGKQIEGDVQSAIDATLKQAPVDATRIAIRGGSYGGYSALMGLIKTPERFRCGIATSAVTDVPLMFTSSDWSDNATARDRMLRVVGDPNKSMADLEAISPDRLYGKLERPLLLVHGAADRRVTLEHMLRLMLMLAHAGRPPEWVLFSNERHGTRDPANRYLLEATADKFLAGCLGATH